MAHNLYQNTMAYCGETPWHKLGIQFTEPFTASEALDAAHLGYEVAKETTHRPDGSAIPDTFSTVNMDTNEILGTVSGRYQVLQNKDAFKFFDALLDSTGARYETAGALGKGERIWIMARMPGGFMPVPGDEILPYCLLHQSHDGTGSVTARFTGIRVVCNNTLTMALSGSREVVSIRHTRTVEQRLQMAGMVLNGFVEHYAAMGETMGKLAKFTIDDDWLDLYLKSLCGDPDAEDIEQITATKRANKIDRIEWHYQNGLGHDIPGVTGSAWGAYNAAIEWADYEFPTRGDGGRTDTILFGAANKFRQTALDTAMAMVNA
jgi:phage/plasmid-like protein (TIGR03299 family)